MCERFKSSRFKGETVFIDNQNLQKTPSGCLGMIVAWSDNKIDWKLGVVATLHPNLISIVEVIYCPSSKKYVFLKQIHRFHPKEESKDNKLVLHFVNFLTPNMKCKEDNCVECPHTGPDVIPYKALPKWMIDHVMQCRELTPKLYSIQPSFDFHINRRKSSPCGFLNFNKGNKSSSRKALNLKCQKVAKFSDCHKNDLKLPGFACPLMESNDKGYMTFCILDDAATNQVLKKDTYGKEEYNNLITSLATDKQTMKIHKLRENITLSFEVGDVDEEIVEEVAKEAWEREGILASTWTKGDEIKVHDQDNIEFMLQDIYGRSTFN